MTEAGLCPQNAAAELLNRFFSVRVSNNNKGVKLISKLPVVSQQTPDKKPKRTKYIRRVEDIDQLSSAEAEELAKVSEKFVFRANDYYIKLINWDDPNDPIRNLIIPNTDELTDWGKLDASNEEAVTVVPGVQSPPLRYWRPVFPNPSVRPCWE